MSRLRRIFVLVTLLAMVMSGCSGGDDSAGEKPPGKAASTASPTAAVTPEPVSCPNGKLIPAVEIPAVHADPVQIPEAKIGGQVVPAVTIPGVDIPAQRVPAQCLTVQPAPGACLGAVSVPPTSIPGVEIPGVAIPGVNVGGIKVDPVRQDTVGQKAVTQDGVSTGEVCQAKPPEDGGYVSSVWRPSVYRPSLYRPSVYRPSLYRPSGCHEGVCVPGVNVPGVKVDGVKIDGVSVPGEGLKGRTVGSAEVWAGKDGVAYSLKTDVLFDVGKADLKPAAAAELTKVAADIKKNASGPVPIVVEGHTDSQGDDPSNQTLSEQRAQAVADWLATKGGIDKVRLKTKGYGETKPAAPNTNDAGRAKNRRVVISVQRG